MSLSESSPQVDARPDEKKLRELQHAESRLHTARQVLEKAGFDLEEALAEAAARAVEAPPEDPAAEAALRAAREAADAADTAARAALAAFDGAKGACGREGTVFAREGRGIYPRGNPRGGAATSAAYYGISRRRRDLRRISTRRHPAAATPRPPRTKRGNPR